MEKQEDNYSAPNFAGLDYPMDHHHHHHHHSNNYLLNNLPQQQQEQQLSFAEVMNFADFGPKLALNQTLISEEDRGLEAGNNNNNDEDDPVYFLKFPVLNDDEENDPRPRNNEERLFMRPSASTKAKDREEEQEEGNYNDQEEEDRDDDMSSVHLQFLGEDLQRSINNNNNESGSVIANPSGGSEPNNNAIATNTNNKKRKRPRSLKTSEEVESQRMTHIAVERNRRKQMNEHLRVLRSLMPGSYVQRGDQASIIGGAIEFVRELEQLLQCLESQKRRRLLGDQLPPGDSSSSGGVPVPPAPPFILAAGEEDCMTSSSAAAAASSSFREETAESKSCIADVEVRVAGFDAVIKILSRRRPGQLLKAISALEDLQFNILHTNITTIEHTVLYSFNVKVTSESSFSAEDIAISVQQIFSFIHASTTM